MSRLRGTPETAAAVASGGAILAMAGILLYMLLVPPPSLRSVEQWRREQERQLVSETVEARKRLREAQAANRLRVWEASPEEIGPAALGRVSALARRRGLTLIAFRPQKSAPAAEGLIMLPYTISIEGAFPAAAEFVRDLETLETKLAVNLIQLAAADAASDRVTATIGVVAYMREDGNARPGGGGA